MDVIKEIFYGLLGIAALFVLGTIIPGILYTLFVIASFLMPIFLICKFLYRIFIAGGFMVKWCILVGVFFAIDYIMQNEEKMLMVWGLAAFVCCIYALFNHVLKNDTEHIQ